MVMKLIWDNGSCCLSSGRSWPATCLCLRTTVSWSSSQSLNTSLMIFWRSIDMINQWSPEVVRVLTEQMFTHFNCSTLHHQLHHTIIIFLNHDTSYRWQLLIQWGSLYWPLLTEFWVHQLTWKLLSLQNICVWRQSKFTTSSRYCESWQLNHNNQDHHYWYVFCILWL